MNISPRCRADAGDSFSHLLPGSSQHISLHSRLYALTLLVGTLINGAAAQSPQLVAETDPLTPQEQLQKFHLPPGFKIELIAAEPECQKPMNLKFDATGRLWFTQSIEYPWPVKEGQTGRDTIRIISDSDHNGVPDRVEVYASGLNIPIGLTPIHDGVLGYSIPTLYHFTDADHDGKADQRQEFYRTFGFRDTHGMCSSLNWWIDGWVYGCHGFSNESEIAGADGKPIRLQSGNTYRLKPDGSHIEYVTHGQVNPFGMCFDPLGNQYTSDCHTKPAYQLVRGAYYPSFGKPHDGLGFGPELMSHLHGSTGIAGVVYYAATQFPTEFHDNLIIGNPVTGRINRDTLETVGSTSRAIEQPDLVTCDDPWFRPVDIQLAPDGSLYIADFYNRIIGHYEVPLTHPGRDRERGRIWRVSYVGSTEAPATPPVADLTQLSTADLIEQLAHPHLPVRVQATHQLVHRVGPAAKETASVALSGASPFQRAHALWVVERLGGLSAPQIGQLAGDPDRLVRVHLVRALGERPVWSEGDYRMVLERLQIDSDAMVIRTAADALGKHPERSAESALIAAWLKADPRDGQLIHTARIALRDSLAAENRLAQLDVTDWTPAQRNCVLEALLGLHQPASAAMAMKIFELQPWPAPLVEPLVQHVVRYLPTERETQLAALIERYGAADVKLQLRVLRSAQRGFQERGETRLEPWTKWANAAAQLVLATADEGSVRAGLELVRDLQLVASAENLTRELRTEVRFPQLRSLVIEVLAAVNHPQLISELTQLVDDAATPVDLRQQSAQVLGSLNRDDARLVLKERLIAAPGNLALALSRGLAATPVGGEDLLQMIETGKASPRLLQDATVDQRLRLARLPDFDARRARLLEGLPPENEELRQLLEQRKTAYAGGTHDVSRGRQVYEKTCAACHRLGNQGGKVGPELDGVGLRGLDRLLEDTLDPNRNVDAAFRSSTVVMENGKVYNGLIAREEGAVLIMIDDQGKEFSIPLAEIEERQTTRLSPMPANIVDKLSVDDYGHLLAFLLEQRIAPTKPAP